MRNPHIPLIAAQVRSVGLDVFDDWYSPGPQADDEWQRYETQRGRSYIEALYGRHASEVYDFDKVHLDLCEAAVLVTPAGKSGHLELGYIRGLGKPAYILIQNEPDRFDIMYRLATQVFSNTDDLVKELMK